MTNNNYEVDSKNKENKINLWFRNPTENDVEYFFEFKNKKFLEDGLIFIITGLIIPFLCSAILEIGFSLHNSIIDNNGSWQYYTNSIIYFGSNGIGWIILYLRNHGDLKRSYFYWFIYFPILAALVLQVIATSVSSSSSQNEIGNICSMFGQIGAEVLIIIFFLKQKFELNKIKNTFKKEKKQMLAIILIGILLMFVLSVVICSYLIEEVLLKVNESDNQKQLMDVLESNNNIIKVLGYGSLILLTIFVAPLCEEICMRYSVFHLSNNRYIAIIVSALYFGFVHYGLEGDFYHFFSYTSAGLLLALIFNYTNGNITYNWIVHALYNTITIIISLGF